MLLIFALWFKQIRCNGKTAIFILFLLSYFSNMMPNKSLLLKFCTQDHHWEEYDIKLFSRLIKKIDPKHIYIHNMYVYYVFVQIPASKNLIFFFHFYTLAYCRRQCIVRQFHRCISPKKKEKPHPDVKTPFYIFD